VAVDKIKDFQLKLQDTSPRAKTPSSPRFRDKGAIDDDITTISRLRYEFKTSHH